MSENPSSYNQNQSSTPDVSVSKTGDSAQVGPKNQSAEKVDLPEKEFLITERFERI